MLKRDILVLYSRVVLPVSDSAPVSSDSRLLVSASI